MDKIKMELEKVNKEIRDAENSIAKMEGQIEGEKKRLEEMGVPFDTVPEVLKRMEKELETLQDEINKEFEKLKEIYKW